MYDTKAFCIVQGRFSWTAVRTKAFCWFVVQKHAHLHRSAERYLRPICVLLLCCCRRDEGDALNSPTMEGAKTATEMPKNFGEVHLKTICFGKPAGSLEGKVCGAPSHYEAIQNARLCNLED